MLKRFTLYPFLFILFVILNPLTTNMDEINPAMALRPLVVLLVIAAALLLLLRSIAGNWHYAGYLLFLGLFMFFTYGHLNNVLVGVLPESYAQVFPLILLAILALGLVSLGLRKTWKRFGEGSRVTPFLNLVLALALFSQGLVGITEWVKLHPGSFSRFGEETHLPVTGTQPALDCSVSPDIYWIILDGYGRADVLQEIYGVDTSPFLDSLKGKGFYIADQSHSNYLQTVYSISSTLNFEYQQPKPVKVAGYIYFPELIATNRLMALLRQCGYQNVAFETGFRFTSYPDADIYLSFGTEPNEFEEMLLESTPLALLSDKLFVKPPVRSYEAHRARVDFAFETLAELPEMNGPQFVFAHIISPHPPFVFDATGNPIQPQRSYSMVDGDDYHGSWAEYRRGYAAQVQYVNQRLDEAISAIIQRSPTPPVIIVQGDHGPGGLLKWKSPARSCLWERAAILQAYYLPDGGAKYLYPDISPVNSFRIVLNAYFGTDLELLPDETYFTSPRAGGPFIDVTDRREARANCD